MINYQRQYPLFSACGLNCGLCPRYHTDGVSKCPGYAGEGFSAVHPPCGILSCSQRHGTIYCYMCEEYPCKKYDNADASDSFITHRNQLRDLDKARNNGIDVYIAELNEKIDILRDLLDNYNDGRRKNFFCIAVNILEMDDVKNVMEKIKAEINTEDSINEKSKTAVRLFQDVADERNIILELRKKKL